MLLSQRNHPAFMQQSAVMMAAAGRRAALRSARSTTPFDQPHAVAAASVGCTVQRLPSTLRAPNPRALHFCTSTRPMSFWSRSALGARLSAAFTGRGMRGLPESYAPLPLPPRSDPSSWHPQLGVFGCGLNQPADFECMAEQCITV